MLDNVCYSSDTQSAYTTRQIQTKAYEYKSLCFVYLSTAQIRVFGEKKNSANTHCDIGECRPHHKVEDPGLQLEDVGWREHHPSGGQDEEEDGRKEGQKSLIQAAVLQSVIAVSPAKPEKVKGAEHWLKYYKMPMRAVLTPGHCRGSWVKSH